MLCVYLPPCQEDLLAGPISNFRTSEIASCASCYQYIYLCRFKNWVLHEFAGRTTAEAYFEKVIVWTNLFGWDLERKSSTRRRGGLRRLAEEEYAGFDRQVGETPSVGLFHAPGQST